MKRPGPTLPLRLRETGSTDETALHKGGRGCQFSPTLVETSGYAPVLAKVKTAPT